MNEMTDMEFYGKHLYKPVTAVIEEYQIAARKTKETNKRIQELKKTNDIHNLQELLTVLPAVKSREATAEKHSLLLSHLLDKADDEGLKDVAQVQQETTNSTLGASASQLESKISKIINSSKYTSLDKLKLILLFALRFEDNKSRVNSLREKLRSSEARKEKGLKDPSLALIDTIVYHMGKHKRVGDCFVKSGLMETVMGNVNVLESDPALLSVMKSLCSGKLSPAEYPFMGDRTSDVPDDIIVYFVGGTTYAEARTVHQINTNTTGSKKKGEKCFRNKNVILGGTSVLRSITFLKYLRELANQRGDL